jgi:hypothetical protein
MGEETYKPGDTLSAAPTFILDPIDGTYVTLRYKTPSHFKKKCRFVNIYRTGALLASLY